MKGKKFWEELITYFPWYHTGHIENDASNNSSIKKKKNSVALVR
jgi:hypothetical protein